ncbi:MAG: NUDIX domain-containing protein [Candidatus Paceibacterota bacterium]|jgi:hypothetical protein
MTNHFRRSAEYPFHISIGGIVVNGSGEICCHYYDKFELAGAGELRDFYLLMRETIEPGESIEGCLARGLMEEFGAESTIRHYIGAIVSKFFLAEDEPAVEKTTLYFLCDFIYKDETKRKLGDPECGSKIVWMKPNDLIEKMKEQGIRLGRKDADESQVVENAIPYIKMAI